MSWMKLAQSTSLDGYSFTNCTFNNSIINLPSPQIASTKNGKDKYSAIIKNSSRYGSDTHRIWIFKTAKNDKISVVFELRNERNGFLVLSDFWHYHSSELDTVKSTYDSLIKISEELKNKIESDDVPISLVTPMFKNSIKYIDIAHKEKSTVNNFNYSMREPIEYDWKRNLYGNRIQLDDENPANDEYNKTASKRMFSIFGY